MFYDLKFTTFAIALFFNLDGNVQGNSPELQSLDGDDLDPLSTR